jgi:hypothetical protein
VTGSEVPVIEEGQGGAIGQTAGLNEKRESKSSGGGSEEAKGNDDSSKTTYRGINRRFVVRSRHRYPL